MFNDDVSLVRPQNYKMPLVDKVKSHIRDIKDFPKPGIVFKDITPVFADPGLMDEIVRELVSKFHDKRIDAVAAVEARGFIFGAILAHALKCRFIPIRKAGKLPFQTRKQEYALEYGTSVIEMHEDAVEPGWRVLVHDDLLATGGTAVAAATLLKSMGAELVDFSFIINLGFLPGAQKLQEAFGIKPTCLVQY